MKSFAFAVIVAVASAEHGYEHGEYQHTAAGSHYQPHHETTHYETAHHDRYLDPEHTSYELTHHGDQYYSQHESLQGSEHGDYYNIDSHHEPTYHHDTAVHHERTVYHEPVLRHAETEYRSYEVPVHHEAVESHQHVDHSDYGYGHDGHHETFTSHAPAVHVLEKHYQGHHEPVSRHHEESHYLDEHAPEHLTAAVHHEYLSHYEDRDHNEHGWNTMLSNGALQEPNFTPPKDDCCNLYQNTNYGGSQVSFCLGGNSSKVYTTGSFNDKTSSWACGKRVAYDFCKNKTTDNCEGDNGNSGAGNAKSGQIGNENSLSTLKLYKYDPSKQAAVTAFQDKDCKRKSARFYAPKTAGQSTRYTKSEMWKHNMGNDMISSIMIPQGLSVTLYDNDSWGGSSVDMSGGFTDSKQAMKCQNLPSLNEKVTSLEVKNNSATSALAIGYWQSVASGHSAEFKVATTFTTTKGSSKTKEQQTTLTDQMRVGTAFEGETITSSFSKKLTQSATDTYSKSETTTVTVTCGKPGDAVQYGVWQWNTKTHDGESNASTALIICRTGNNVWNKEPACPWTACIDGMCTKCDSNWKK